MSPHAPVRSLEQSLAALRKANRSRTKRAEMKAELKAGEPIAADLLASPPWWLATMKVESFLLALPKIGDVKAARILRDLKISPAKTIAGMSDRQRGVLLAELRLAPSTPDLLAALDASRAAAVRGATRPLSLSEQAQEA